jgi:hypothetical protein
MRRRVRPIVGLVVLVVEQIAKAIKRKRDKKRGDRNEG